MSAEGFDLESWARTTAGQERDHAIAALAFDLWQACYRVLHARDGLALQQHRTTRLTTFNALADWLGEDR